MSDELLDKYKAKIEPLLPLAQKAYGSRNNSSPEHTASRKYTALLTEYYAKGGSLVAMADALGVVYSGLRRRVKTADLPVIAARKRSRLTDTEIQDAVDRIKAARDESVEAYHEQIAEEYDNGASLIKIAEALGLSSSGPLYYAVNSVRLKENEE